MFVVVVRSLLVIAIVIVFVFLGPIWEAAARPVAVWPVALGRGFYLASRRNKYRNLGETISNFAGLRRAAGT